MRENCMRGLKSIRSRIIQLICGCRLAPAGNRCGAAGMNGISCITIRKLHGREASVSCWLARSGCGGIGGVVRSV